jgi:hypothetical protein
MSLTTVHKVTLQGKFINAEFSWGRWNGDDARQLEEPLLSVIFRMSKWFNTPLYYKVSFLQVASWAL